MVLTIKVLSHGRTIKAQKGELLADKLQQSGIPLSLYCNKRGLCGKCFVEIVKGRRPYPAEREKYWLEQRGLSGNHRLACLYQISGDLEINIPASFTYQDVPVLPTIARSVVTPDPAVKKYYLQLRRPNIAAPDSLFELLLDGLGVGHLSVPIEVLRELEPTIEGAGFKVTITVHGEKEIISVEPGNTLDRNFGLAVDVGTTTLVMELVDSDSGRTLDMEAALNPQSKRGADVISRITYALDDPKNAAELRELIIGALNGMIRHLLVRNRVAPSSVYEIVISGNTAMSHFLLGLPLNSLATAPYHAVYSCLPALSARETGLATYPLGKVYFSPNIRSFVGGDIASGLLASRLASKRGNFLFIDLGTNGEIVLKAGRRLVTTSTAAGPAFEGMSISCGMPALSGAIYKAEHNGVLKVQTLGNGPAKGICGTGLIDLIAVFLARGEIEPRGAIRNREKKIRVAGQIVLTQEDVRQLQLACAAVKAGVRMILEGNDLAVEDLSGVYIAGAFGSYLNIHNSQALGLLPRMDERRIVFIGNSSLAGARLLLVAKEERDKVESMVRKIRYVSLASDRRFQDYFIEALEFKSWP
jgi:uncharacterized 2Fe-2S/4Fe-4S cluster protein (DUF4445 family)